MAENLMKLADEKINEIMNQMQSPMPDNSKYIVRQPVKNIQAKIENEGSKRKKRRNITVI